MTIDTSPKLLSSARRQLLRWYRMHRRDLPWRATRDPYSIWVSEAMLQQTQVATVIPYFQRFIAAFPDIESLATASEAEVMRHWEGLGYYRRARHLHAAAKQIQFEFKGQFPRDPAVLGKLPGFGRYTIGAVLSQAFDVRLPIVEANSIRVLSRVFGIQGDPKSTATQSRLWSTAEILLPKRHCGEFNQALMELGALVCTVKTPMCDRCPLRRHCYANEHNLQNVLPARPSRPDIVDEKEVALVVYRRNSVLLVKRPDHGRWAGMWEFPHIRVEPEETIDHAAKRLAEELLGLEVDLGHELITIVHGVTRFRITICCVEARWRRSTFASTFYVDSQWLKPQQLHSIALSSPQRKIARQLVEVGQGRLF